MASGRGLRPSLALTAVGAGMLLALTFPLLAAQALAAFGPRVVSGALLLLGAASLALARRAEASAPAGGAGFVRALPLALPALAAVTGDARFLRLVPAALELGLAALFLASLRGGSSILEQAARTLEPYAPDFIAGYCRKATRAFALLFVLQAAALVAVALTAPPERWALASSLWIWLPTLGFTALEFVFRKAWFRHYGGAPWDRVLRALLPPENTARGRRSLEWIRQKRAELGLPPP